MLVTCPHTAHSMPIEPGVCKAHAYVHALQLIAHDDVQTKCVGLPALRETTGSGDKSFQNSSAGRASWLYAAA